MAAKKSTLPKSVRDELICAFCLDSFKDPKMLPCLHSFCADCLQDLVTISPKKNHVSCPECRVQHAVPSKGFTNHFLLGRLVKHLTIHEAITCGSGLDSNVAAGWCVDCHSYLCQQCVDLHKQLKMSRNHKTLTLAELKEEALTQADQKHMCSEHEGVELNLYCKTCQDVICRDCAVVTHKRHKYVFIEDAKEEIVQGLQELMAQVEEKDREFQEYITEINTVMAAKNEIISECEKQVNNYFDAYIQKIQQHEILLLHKIHHAEKNDEKSLVTEKEDLGFTKARLTSGITFTKQLLSSGSLADIALLSKQTSQQLRSLARMKKRLAINKDISWFSQNKRPMDRDVLISSPPTFVGQLEDVPHGLNKIGVHAPVRPDVNITTDSGKPCKVIEVIPTGSSSWRVTYIIPIPPLTKSVHITAQIVGYSISKTIPCINQLAEGTRVTRGPDWNHGNEDGGPGNVGIVVVLYVPSILQAFSRVLFFTSSQNRVSENGVRVRWNGMHGIYSYSLMHGFPIKTEI